MDDGVDHLNACSTVLSNVTITCLNRNALRWICYMRVVELFNLHLCKSRGFSFVVFFEKHDSFTSLTSIDDTTLASLLF